MQKRGFIGPALIIAVAIVLIGAGILGAFYIGKKSPGPTATNPVVQASPTLDVTANWKTYSGSSIDFAFKYPENFQITSAEKGPNNPYDLTISISSPDSASEQMHITLFVTKNTQNLTLEKYLQELYAQPYHPGGNPSYTVEGIFKDFIGTNKPLPNSFSYIGNLGGAPSKTTFFAYKDKLYEFTLFVGTGAGSGKVAPTAEKIYDQILFTFKFTN